MSSEARPRGPGGFVALATICVAGCAVGPDFTRPAPPSVDRYDQTQIVLPGAGNGQQMQRLNPGITPAERWWRAFGSASLNETVELALANSPTLAAARATLAASTETLAAARGALYPQADLGASASLGTGGGVRSSFAGTVHLYSIGPSASYTPDIFGGTRRRIEQQSALADYQRGQVGAAYLSLTGSVVTGAINIASAQEQLTAVNEIIGADEQNLRLVQISAAAGKSAGTEVLAAEGQLANDRALLPPLRQQLDVARHALALLVGRTPADWLTPDFRFDALTLPSDLPLTLPSELVRSRPDILAAEAQLRAASAAVGVATAGLYPSLALTGSWTSTATSTADLFNPAGRIWAIAAALTDPLFHGGALAAERRATIDTFNAQLSQYRQTVLLAFGQVADALNALQHDAEAVEAEQAALEASRASMELTQQSYQAGQASFIDLLEAQRLYQQARLGIARAESGRFQNTALLFLALGGDAPH